jgi:hypothetical protein
MVAEKPYVDHPIRYFSQWEMQCTGTGVIKADRRFVDWLLESRDGYGRPMPANSICRTPTYNRIKRGHPNSLHLTENPKHATHGSMAIDIGWRHLNRAGQLELARYLWSRGASLGLHNGFLHADLRVLLGLPQIIFIYGDWDGRIKFKEITAK